MIRTGKGEKDIGGGGGEDWKDMAGRERREEMQKTDKRG